LGTSTFIWDFFLKKKGKLHIVDVMFSFAFWTTQFKWARWTGHCLKLVGEARATLLSLRQVLRSVLIVF